MSDTDNLRTLVTAIKENRLLDQTEMTELENLQSRCTAPSELAKELMDRGSLTRYQTEQLFSGEGRKLVLGSYILLEPLGEGGMGQVYKARHVRMKRIVALKIIRKDNAAGSIALQRFEQEIEAAAQLQHPNIVIAYDANEVDNIMFFVMEYVEGIDLGKLVQRFGKVPVGNAADYIRQAAGGLQHAHERGMVHRDIKPSNLLLAYVDAKVKILDMGLARLKEKNNEPTKQLTFTGMVMGTPDFISPEQAKDSRLADIRSDLYSLGCTFYYLLAGRVPFVEGTFTEKLLKHTLEEPTPLEELAPEVPKDVLAIVKKLMSKKPADRYQTPAELEEALKPFATAERTAERLRPPKDAEKDPEWNVPAISQVDATLQRPVPSALRAGVNDATEANAGHSGPQLAPRGKSLVREGPMRPAPRIEAQTEEEPQGKTTPRRRPSPMRRATLAILAGTVLAFGAAVAWKAAKGGFGLGTQVVIATTAATSPNTGTDKATRPETKPDTKPDTKIVPDTRPAPDTRPKTLEPPLEGVIVDGIREKDEEHKNDPTRAAISPDGRWLTLGWNDFLWTWNLDKSKPGSFRDHQLLDSPLFAVAATNDGRILLSTSYEVVQAGKVPRPMPVLTLWDPAIREPARRMSPVDKEISAIAFSREGYRALSGSEDRTVRLWDLRSGKDIKQLKKHDGKVTAVALSADGTKALSGARDNRVIYWDLEAGKDLATFTDHGATVTAVAFSPDGKYALSGGFDRKVILWDLEKKARVRTHEDHKNPITALAFSPDSKRFLTGSEDQIVHLYSVDAGEYVGKMPYHKGTVLSLAFSPDGKYGLSVATDNTARRWKLPASKAE
jgi:eukaryotic-like serine/threonine-protein kinase